MNKETNEIWEEIIISLRTGLIFKLMSWVIKLIPLNTSWGKPLLNDIGDAMFNVAKIIEDEDNSRK